MNISHAHCLQSGVRAADVHYGDAAAFYGVGVDVIAAVSVLL
jgi:hypothetical protein